MDYEGNFNFTLLVKSTRYDEGSSYQPNYLSGSIFSTTIETKTIIYFNIYFNRIGKILIDRSQQHVETKQTHLYLNIFKLHGL